MKFLDSHLHLQDKRIFARADEIIRRAEENGVGLMLCNGTWEQDWPDVLKFAEKHDSLFPMLGVHPWFVETVSAGWLETLTEMVTQGWAGIGEIGLDKLAKSDLRTQERIFTIQLSLAEELQRPVAIHCVKAWGKLLEILDNFDLHALPVMIHAFAGSLEIMERLVGMGAYVSFSTQLARPAREKLRQVFLRTPLDSLLLETDSPNQFCPELAGSAEYGEEKVNQPAVIPSLYGYGAALRSMNIDEFSKVVWRNGQIFTN